MDLTGDLECCNYIDEDHNIRHLRSFTERIFNKNRDETHKKTVNIQPTVFTVKFTEICYIHNPLIVPDTKLFCSLYKTKLWSLQIFLLIPQWCLWKSPWYFVLFPEHFVEITKCSVLFTEQFVGITKYFVPFTGHFVEITKYFVPFTTHFVETTKYFVPFTAHFVARTTVWEQL